MKRTFIAAAAVCAFVFAASASAALVPGVYDPGNTKCPTATYSHGVLHLAKNCATSTNASAGADITGVAGQTFTSASFTLASTAQCQGGSPRFNVVTTAGTFFLGCNNVVPTVNGDGTATYTFTASTIAAGGNQVAVPTGTITSMEILIDVQGTADISNVVVNGTHEVPVAGNAAQCKHGGWKTFASMHFKNQGQCVKWTNEQRHRLEHPTSS